MSYRIELDQKRCQSYGNCLQGRAQYFAWDRAHKVRVSDPEGALRRGHPQGGETLPLPRDRIGGRSGRARLPALEQQNLSDGAEPWSMAAFPIRRSRGARR